MAARYKDTVSSSCWLQSGICVGRRGDALWQTGPKLSRDLGAAGWVVQTEPGAPGSATCLLNSSLPNIPQCAVTFGNYVCHSRADVLCKAHSRLWEGQRQGQFLSWNNSLLLPSACRRGEEGCGHRDLVSPRLLLATQSWRAEGCFPSPVHSSVLAVHLSENLPGFLQVT